MIDFDSVEKFVVAKRPYLVGKIDDNDNRDIVCPTCKANSPSSKSILRLHCWKCGQLMELKEANA